ncbi:MAG TPA: hypothetical protein ENN40_11390 [Candidatus Aminicenantes bacterium]|nr:hypothetical protein [Candidatus Aminicenantes bacterium]
MKKALIMSVIVFLSIGLSAQIPRLDPDKVPAGAIALISPGNDGYISSIPVEIVFRWQKTAGVLNYTFVLQVEDGGAWKTTLTRPNLTGDHITVTYNRPSDLRWQVVGIGPRGVRYESPWWVLHYGGSASAAQGKTVSGQQGVAGSHVETKPTPQFRPVLLTPKNEVVLRHYPRNMTFTWMHSTNPAFRRYQIQVDIYHPRPEQWQSAMRNNTLLVDEVIRDNEYHFKFPADRLGRWRVRGVKDPRTFTPWSPWRTFSFRARH